MVLTLQKLFFQYYDLLNHISRLHEQTLSSLTSVKNLRKLEEDLLDCFEYKKEELDILENIITNQPCILISGQNFVSKILLMIKILEQEVFPISILKNRQDSVSFSAIHINYGFENTFTVNSGETEDENQELCNLSLNDLTEPVPYNHMEKCDNRIVKISLKNDLLKNGTKIIISPTYANSISKQNAKTLFQEFCYGNFFSFYPIVLFGIAKSTFSDFDISHMKVLQKLGSSKTPMLFVRTPSLPDFQNDLPECDRTSILRVLSALPPTAAERKQKLIRNSSRLCNESSDEDSIENKTEIECDIPESLLFVLCDKMDFLSRQSKVGELHEFLNRGEEPILNDIISNFELTEKFQSFFDFNLRSRLVTAAIALHDVHFRCMRMMILHSFDMAREVQITPRRLNYVKDKESKLYKDLIEIASKKQNEIKSIIAEALSQIKEKVLVEASIHEFKSVQLTYSMSLLSPRDTQACAAEIEDLVITKVNSAVAQRLSERLETLRRTYLGTLQRCLETLENYTCENGESTHACDTLKLMLNAAYQLDVSSTGSSSILKSFWERLKQLISSMPGTQTAIDPQWKQKAAQSVFENLSENRLAKNICNQLKERLTRSHDSFLISMKHLELKITKQLEEKEQNHQKIKKLDAPKIASLSLESTSLRDKILYGTPVIEKEVGRGQYGVVFSCKKWGKFRTCAVKSVVPTDEKHWHDLAMEFHYTRSIGEHDRIVCLRGSVIDYNYGSDNHTTAILLIMDRLCRDLYTGIKCGLEWLTRLQIALDVAQGIRFLHSQGLIHRDIKLKNVLLNSSDRAKLTDLGFCKPGAMISGSIVGTPIHMAPELLAQRYDNSVDVYAFGILFWYICSGSVKMPAAFDHFHCQENLWQYVKKGVRPERLPNFNDECWKLMNECWATKPHQRPFLGNIEPRILDMIKSL